MSQSIFNIGIAILMAVGIGGIVFSQTQSFSANPTGVTPASSAITIEEVATHNTRESCWSMINGNVYDLTSWIPNHPGGERNILQLCGIDGSSLFNGQHGGSSRHETILAGFRISGPDGAATGSTTPPVSPIINDDDDDDDDDSGQGRGRGGDNDDD